MSHTSGPWTIMPEKLLNGQHAAGREPHIMAGPRPVARVARLGQKPKDGEAEANAALIAAAPEMLEALRKAYEYIDDGLHARKPRHNVLNLTAEMRTAFSKAIGRQP